MSQVSPIYTASCKPVDVMNLGAADVRIKDIAYGLGNRCRFACQSEFYSVAQHSMLTADLLPASLKLPGLMHDTDEYLMGDIPTPIKYSLASLSEYLEAGELARKIVFSALEIPWPSETDWRVIKSIDYRLAVTEALQLFETPPEWAEKDRDKALPIRIFPLQPRAAREAFLKRYRELRGEE